MVPRRPTLMPFAAEHISSYYGAFASESRVLVEANLRCAERFGIDQLNTMIGYDEFPEFIGMGHAARLKNLQGVIALIADAGLEIPQQNPRINQR